MSKREERSKESTVDDDRIESLVLTTDREDFEEDTRLDETHLMQQMNTKINSLNAQIEHLKQQLTQKLSKSSRPNWESADLESHQFLVQELKQKNQLLEKHNWKISEHWN